MYFRIQEPGLSLEDMQSFVSDDGGDGYKDEFGGICACDSVGSMIRNTAFSTEWGLEVVVFKGRNLTEIYDGHRVFPTKIVDRIDAKKFYELSLDGDSIIYDYENE